MHGVHRLRHGHAERVDRAPVLVALDSDHRERVLELLTDGSEYLANLFPGELVLGVELEAGHPNRDGRRSAVRFGIVLAFAPTPASPASEESSEAAKRRLPPRRVKLRSTIRQRLTS